MQNTFSPQDSLGRSLLGSPNIKSLNLSTTAASSFQDDSGKLVAIEEVLRKLVSVCLLANLVSSKIDYGDELSKRLLETKVFNIKTKTYRVGNVHYEEATTGHFSLITTSSEWSRAIDDYLGYT